MQKRKLIKVIKNKRGTKTYVMECCFCKKPFPIDASRFNVGANKFCSHSCSRKGTPHPNYKKRIKRSGYWYIHLPPHPSCKNKKQKYVAEHRIIMERFLRRPLLFGEIVHHIDGNITNNKIENLKLYQNAGYHISREHTIRCKTTGKFLSKIK